MVVTITADNYGQASGVTEMLPAGFTYVSSSLDVDQVTVTDQEVRFTLQGDSSFTYRVTASRTAGSYRFEGTLRDFDWMDQTVGGDTTVTVARPRPRPTSSTSDSGSGSGGGGFPSSPTSTPTPVPTSTPTPEPTATPTPVPTATSRQCRRPRHA